MDTHGEIVCDRIAAGWSNICFKDVLQAPNRPISQFDDVMLFAYVFRWWTCCLCVIRILGKFYRNAVRLKTTVSEKGTCEQESTMGMCLCTAAAQHQFGLLHIHHAHHNTQQREWNGYSERRRVRANVPKSWSVRYLFVYLMRVLCSINDTRTKQWKPIEMYQ